MALRESLSGRTMSTKSIAWLVSFLENTLISILVFCWLTPIAVSVAIAASLHRYIVTNDLSFSSSQVASIASGLTGILAAVSALLVAVLMSVYVQGRRNRIDGFNLLLEALSDYKMLILRIEDIGHFPWWGRAISEDLVRIANQFVERMNCITPAWRGYAADRQLQQFMDKYVTSAGKKMIQLQFIFPRQIHEIYTYHERYLRVMAISLRTMDEGTVERKLERRLFGVFLSVAALLVLSLATSTIAELEAPASLLTLEFVNPFFYVLLPAMTVGNFAIMVYSVHMWQSELRKRDEAWAS